MTFLFILTGWENWENSLFFQTFSILRLCLKVVVEPQNFRNSFVIFSRLKGIINFLHRLISEALWLASRICMMRISLESAKKLYKTELTQVTPVFLNEYRLTGIIMCVGLFVHELNKTWPKHLRRRLRFWSLNFLYISNSDAFSGKDLSPFRKS